MGMTENRDYWLYGPAGVLIGLGSTIILIQCDTLVSQYFRLKLPILNQISQIVATLGCLAAPIILGHSIINSNISHILLWYQAIILQGLVVSIVFKKPPYLKSKQKTKPYQFVLSSPDDEEDILSKNSRELQIKRTKTHVSKIPINEPQPGTSKNDEIVTVHGEPSKKKNWETFDEEDNEVKEDKTKKWEEAFHDEDDTEMKPNWERFEEDEPPSPAVNNLSLAEETNTQMKRPTSLFSDFPVNNNSSYAYDDEITTDPTNTNVFAPNNRSNNAFKTHLEVLKQPTFYKTLLTVVANTYSSFAFFALYPSYLYIQAESVNIKDMTQLLGILFIINLVFLIIIFFFKIDKKRSVVFGIFFWLGSVGYFMVSDFTSESLLLVGGIQIVLSIGALEFTVKPLLRLPTKGGSSSENFLLSIFSSLSLLLFLCLNFTFKTCFRIVAIVHFFTGTLWLVNYIYKRKRIQ